MAEDSKDRRIFHRYSKKIDFKINVMDRLVNAKMFDYSLGGVGAEVDDQQIKSGDSLNIDIPYSSLRFKGTVVRSEKINSHVKVGILRLSGLEGTLHDFKMSDTLIGLSRSGKTGVLHVKSGDIDKSVYIHNGDLIFASSNLSEDRMGDLLLREKKITQNQYDESSDVMIRTKKRHGTVLVEMGILKPHDLVLAVKHYVETIIQSLFNFETGDFVFTESVLPTEEVITLKLSAANLIYRGIKNMSNFKLIEKDCPPPDYILRFSSNPLDLFQDIKMDNDDKQILSMVDGIMTFDEVLNSISGNKERILRGIYALLNTRIIEARQQEEGLDETERHDITHEDIIGNGGANVSEDFAEEINEMYRVYESLGYYGILGVTHMASNDEIKSAYYKMAKRFHPDKHFYLTTDLKEKLNQIFTFITAGYSTLIRADSRKQYDLSFKVKSVSNSDKAKDSFDRGLMMFNQNRFEEASRLFSESAYYDSAIPKYHFYYGVSLSKTGKFKEAEKFISKAIEMEPRNYEFLSEAGHVYLALGLTLRAKKYFEQSLEILPGNRRASTGLARITEILEKESR